MKLDQLKKIREKIYEEYKNMMEIEKIKND